MYYSTIYKSKIGDLTIVADEKNLTGLWFKNQKYFMNSMSKDILQNNDIEIIKRTNNWLDRYFKGDKPNINELSLKPIGSDFRQVVWKILCEIPYGETVTYGEIAKRVSKIFGKDKMSAQAIGGAVGHNPISIIIPCHRVVGTNGSLTGYAAGIDIKKKLLEHEKVDLSKFYDSKYMVKQSYIN